jgi:hypothetical protein
MGNELRYCQCGHTIYWHFDKEHEDSPCCHSACRCLRFDERRPPIPLEPEPTTIELRMPEGIKLGERGTIEVKYFFQSQLDRRCVGGLRYGQPNRRQRYMTRMVKELKAYKTTGNHEHLINIANYAFLESYQPENKKYHFDATVDSVTRKDMGT